MARMTKEQRQLIEVFRKADKDITALLKNAMLDDQTAQMLNEYQRQVKSILKHMRDASSKLGGKIISSEYRGGVKMADAALLSHGVTVQPGTAAIHTRAVKVLSDSLANRFADVTGMIGRRVDDVFRTVQLNAVTGSVMGYETVQQGAEKIQKDLLEKNITGFKDTRGRVWDLETYATMAARTVTTQAHNRGTWNEYVSHGEDLVIVSTHPMSCPKCAPWQGVVLSVTGSTPGYPTIYDAEGDGLFHPNCRHATALFIPDDFTGILITKVPPDEEEPPKEEKAIRGVSVAKIDSLRGERGHIEDDLTPAEGASRIRNDYLHVGIEIDRKEAAAIHKAIWDYSGLEYGSMREAIFKEMKGSKLTSFEQTLVEKFRRVEEYTKIAPRYTNEEGTIYRGIKNTGSQYSKMLNGLKPGDKIDLQKGASFSSRPVKAGSFAKDGGYLLEIKDNSWKNAVSIRPFARTSLEDEVLVSDRRWIVTGVTKNKDGLKVITITRDSK